MAEEDQSKSAQRWADELRRYEQAFKTKFIDRGETVVRRYRDDRKDNENGETRYNILWSNVRTLKPAVFAKIPKPEVSRRWKDKNPVARCAAQVLERAISYEISQYTDYVSSLSNCVDDRLLPGRGVAWIRYEPIIETVDAEPVITEDADEQSETIERITHEQTVVDYVNWKDFSHDAAARTWEEVTWVARRVFMKREDGLERFGDVFHQVPLVNRPKDENQPEAEKDQIATAQVWEIWCKTSKAVYWIATGFSEILDERPDPLELEDFFPCPKPIYATLTTDSLIPVPDYALYQDQAKELDEVCDRIRHLTKSLQAKGVYAADEPSLVRLLKEANDADMIPVTNWPAFTEKGGLAGAFQMLPLKEVVVALQELYRNREAAKQAIYEITGISDIVRGASEASETATAQQIKSQFASIRLNDMKNDVARFARDLIRMKAEIMCSKYQPETLVKMSGMENTPDQDLLPQALMMLKDEPLRNFNIDIEADSLIELDQQQEKQDRVEFLNSVGGFMKEAIQAPPELAPLLGELMLFVIRGFKVGASIEGSFEQFIENAQEQQKQLADQPPQPSPEEMQMQAEARAIQAEMQFKAQEAQAKQEMEQFKLQMEQTKIAADNQVKQLDIQLKKEQEDRKLEFERWKAELDANTKIFIAQMSHAAQKEAAQMSAENEAQKAEQQKPDFSGVAGVISEQMKGFFEQIAESQAQGTSAIVEAISRPKRLVRDAKTNRISGVE